MIDIAIGPNTARLFWVGDTLVEDSYYKDGDRSRCVYGPQALECKIDHNCCALVFESLTLDNVARQVFWGLTGRSVDVHELACLKKDLADFFNSRPVRIKTCRPI